MLSMHIDNINDLAVVECQGRIVGSEAFRLREAVTSQTEARIVVLDLSEVYAIAGGGLGMLVTRDQGIQFKLFNPSRSVRERLEHASSMSAFDIATLHEMMALLGRADPRYALAA